MKKLIFLFAILLCSISHAETTGMFLPGVMQKGFPRSKVVEVLKYLDKPSIAFTAKSFGNSWENVDWILQNLPNHVVRVQIYLSCDPCRAPRRPKGMFDNLAKNLTNQQFNDALIRKDPALVKEIGELLSQIAAFEQRNKNAQIVIVPDLEDTLEDVAFASFTQIIQQFAGYPIYRNPLFWSGYKSSCMRYEGCEKHTYASLSGLKRGDILNGDGELFCFKNEERNKKQFYKPCANYSDLKRLIKSAKAKGIHVLLFRPEWQGISMYKAKASLPPQRRKYQINRIPEVVALLRA